MQAAVSPLRRMRAASESNVLLQPKKMKFHRLAKDLLMRMPEIKSAHNCSGSMS
jgi:hypothetical protein